MKTQFNKRNLFIKHNIMRSNINNATNWHLYNKDKKIASHTKYLDLYIRSYSSTGLIGVKFKNKKWGLIDDNGKVLLEPIYDFINAKWFKATGLIRCYNEGDTKYTYLHLKSKKIIFIKRFKHQNDVLYCGFGL